MNQFFISCKESRVEHNRSFYGCFYLGPFDQGQSLTVANALRRTLLSELSGFAITSVEIEGVLHEYSTIPGVRDTVLDILLNLKEIVIKPSSSYATSTSLAKQTFFAPGELLSESSEADVVPAKRLGLGSASLGPLLSPSAGALASLGSTASLAPSPSATFRSPTAQRSGYVPYPTAPTDEGTPPLLREAKTTLGTASLDCDSSSPGAKKVSSAGLGEEETKDENFTDLEMKDDVFEENVAIGYLQVRGPGVVRSGDLKLPPHFQCVDPDQYIATLSDDGLLNFKFEISKGKNYQIRSHEMILNSFVPEETKNRQLWLKKIKTGTVRHHKTMNDPTDESLRYRVPSSLSPLAKERKPQLREATRLNTRELENAKNRGSSKLFIDAVFMPVTKVNYIIELAEPYYQNESPPSKKHTIILEIWTNGSLHPRKALYDSLKKLVNIFSKLYNVKFLGSMLRSNKTYEKMLHKFNFNIDSSASSLGKPKADAAQDPVEGLAQEAGRNKTSLRSSPEAKKAGRSKGEEVLKAKGLRTQADDQGFAIENNRSAKATALSASDLRSRPSGLGSASLGPLPSPTATVTSQSTVAKGERSRSPQAKKASFARQSSLASQDEASFARTGSTVSLAPVGTGFVPRTSLSKEEKTTSSPQNVIGKPQSQSNRLLEDIGTLKLSLRAYSCLKNNNINTIGDLLQYSPQQLLTFKNLGQRSLEEVQKTLGQIGFSLLP